MVTAASFLTTLPPASLAAADFPRFIARALNRCAHDELPQLLSLLEAQTLSGYPASVAPILRLIVQTVREQALDPMELEPAAIARLMSRREWLQAADHAVGLERTPLRPGEPLGRDVGNLTHDRVRRVPGQGAEHYLVTAAQLVTLPGIGWSTLEGLVVARPMEEPEAEVLRNTWSVIEEHFGFFESPDALPWQAELARIAERNNLEASTCREILQAMTIDDRRRLWRVLLEHLRDGQLDDAHRPSLRALGERLRGADLSLLGARLDHVLALAQSAYASCRMDPAVAEGLCPCHGGDLALYAQWVEVPEASRERLLAMTPQLVEYQLRRLAEMENHDADLPMSPSLRRDLRGLRDGCLRRRYARDLSGIVGIDPLLLAEERLREGHDRAAIIRDLTDLARRVRLAAQETPPQEDPLAVTPRETAKAPIRLLRPEPHRPAPPKRAKRPTSRMANAEPEPTVSEAQAAADDAAFPEDPTVEKARKLAAEAPKPPPQAVAAAPPRTRLEPISERHITSMKLPPLPKPPPWRRPTTRPNISASTLPPMPAPPKRTVAPPSAASAEPEIPIDKLLQKPPPPRRVRPMTSRIITPSQVETFYRNAFRELEILERDLLERGPWQQAKDRLTQLQDETRDLMEAAGPAARSGDADFAAALQRIKFVQSYLDRVTPLLTAKLRPAPSITPEPPRKKRRRWFFSGDDEG